MESPDNFNVHKIEATKIIWFSQYDDKCRYACHVMLYICERHDVCFKRDSFPIEIRWGSSYNYSWRVTCPINKFAVRKIIQPPLNLFKQGLCQQFWVFNVWDSIDGGARALLYGFHGPLNHWYVFTLVTHVKSRHSIKVPYSNCYQIYCLYIHQ